MKRHSKIILLALFVAIAVISPIGAGIAHASLVAGFFETLGIALGEGISYILAMVVKFFIFEPSAYILTASGYVFDSIVPYALGMTSGNNPSAFQSAFIAEGWGIMRDIANMVFIFAMLYIAIATILQVGVGRNTKSLLINIVIIALLVNFSLFLAQVVIEVSNLLALEFYTVLNNASNQNGLAAIVLSGFNPQRLLGTHSFESWIAENDTSYSVLFALYLFGGAVQLISAYVIFWAAFLFIGRIVLLWILMILSPIAFAAFVLPKTQHFFHDWWDKLLNQAFVAPIFLFFLFILALFINDALPRFLASIGNLGGQVATTQIIFEVVLGFSLVIGFMIYSLKMTKKIGGEAAAWATKGAGMALGFAAGGIGGAIMGAGGGARVARLAGMVPGVGGVVGKTLLGAGERVGRVVGVPLRPIGTYGKEAAEKAGGMVREEVGKAAKGVVEAGAKPGFIGAGLRGFGIARGAAKVEARAKAGVAADIEKAQGDLRGFSDAALRTEFGYSTTTAEKRAAVIKILGERKKLKPQKPEEGPMTYDSIDTTLKTVKARGYDTVKEIEDKYLWQYAKDTADRARAVRKLSSENIKELGDEYFKDKEVLRAMFASFGAQHMKEVLQLTKKEVTKKDAAGKPIKDAAGKEVKEPRDYARDFFEALSGELKTKSDELRAKGRLKAGETLVLHEYFHEAENRNAENWSRSTEGKNIANTYDIPYRENKEKTDGEGQKKEESPKPKIEVVTPFRPREELPPENT